MKKESSGAGAIFMKSSVAGAMFMKSSGAGAVSFYHGSVALNNSRCSRTPSPATEMQSKNSMDKLL